MRVPAVFLVVVATACGGRTSPGEQIGSDAGPPVIDRDRDERFIGLWVVEQPSHALYEATLYDLQADGTLVTGRSFPPDCSGHLTQHCVTGSVASCVPATTGDCPATTTCVFGAGWYSVDQATLVIVGSCSDGAPRDIRLAFDPDPGSDTALGGGGATLVSVGGQMGWSHDNWDWVFRKCPDGTDCLPMDL